MGTHWYECSGLLAHHPKCITGAGLRALPSQSPHALFPGYLPQGHRDKSTHRRCLPPQAYSSGHFKRASNSMKNIFPACMPSPWATEAYKTIRMPNCTGFPWTFIVLKVKWKKAILPSSGPPVRTVWRSKLHKVFGEKVPLGLCLWKAQTLVSVIQIGDKYKPLHFLFLPQGPALKTYSQGHHSPLCTSVHAGGLQIISFAGIARLSFPV